jgi:hypothetical protein
MPASPAQGPRDLGLGNVVPSFKVPHRSRDHLRREKPTIFLRVSAERNQDMDGRHEFQLRKFPRDRAPLRQFFAEFASRCADGSGAGYRDSGT